MKLVRKSCIILGMMVVFLIGGACVASAKEDTVKSLKILQSPDKCVYNIGDGFSSAGLKLEATLSSGKKEIADNAQVTAYINNMKIPEGRVFEQEGWKDVRLEYKGVRTEGMVFGVTVFDPKKDYYIQYDSQGGTKFEKAKINASTKAFKLPVPTKKGYVFDGWYESNGIKRTHYIQGVGPNINLTAHWAVKLTFNANGGSGKMASSVISASYKLPKSGFKKSGYKFVGWSLQKQATDEYKFYKSGDESTMIPEKTGGVTLYAQWVKPKSYKITYGSVKGVSVSSKAIKKYTAGKTTALPTPKLSNSLELAGKTFAGWKITVGSKTYRTYGTQIPAFVSGNMKVTPMLANFIG